VCSGVHHLMINILVVFLLLILILIFIDFIPDVDHFKTLSKPTKINTLKNLFVCYFGMPGCQTDGKGFLHDIRIPIILLLISIIWLVHLYFDYLRITGKLIC